jgi:hypothetical protein
VQTPRLRLVETAGLAGVTASDSAGCLDRFRDLLDVHAPTVL